MKIISWSLIALALVGCKDYEKILADKDVVLAARAHVIAQHEEQLAKYKATEEELHKYLDDLRNLVKDREQLLDQEREKSKAMQTKCDDCDKLASEYLKLSQAYSAVKTKFERAQELLQSDTARDIRKAQEEAERRFKEQENPLKKKAKKK